MRTIIAGSRGLGIRSLMEALEHCPWQRDISVVISGGARGIDYWGERLAFKRGIPCERYPADWEAYGRGAGHKRNRHMAYNCRADALLAVWDGVSPGTQNMVGHATAAGLTVFTYTVA